MGPLRPRPASQPASQADCHTAGPPGRWLVEHSPPPKHGFCAPTRAPRFCVPQRISVRARAGNPEFFLPPPAPGMQCKSQRQPVTVHWGPLGARPRRIHVSVRSSKATSHGAAAAPSPTAAAHPRRRRPRGPLGSGPGGAPERGGGAFLPIAAFSFYRRPLANTQTTPERFPFGAGASAASNQPQRENARGSFA